MRPWLTLLLIIGCYLALFSFLPWWSIAVAGIVGASLLPTNSTLLSFGIGMLAGVLLWGIHSGYIHYYNDGLLATRLSFTLGGMEPGMLVILTAVLGGIYCGFGAVVGQMGRRLFQTPQ